MGDNGVVVKVGGETNITGYSENLHKVLSDLDQTLFRIENSLGMAASSRETLEVVKAKPEFVGRSGKGLDSLVGKAIALRIRLLELEGEIIRIVNRLGILDTIVEEAEDAN